MIAQRPSIVQRVLIVDDSESNLYVLSTWLRRAGYDVAEARTGSDALAMISTQTYDLAILDVNLPDMSGYDVCERIKADGEWAATPVLHISSHATGSADRSEGLRRGAEGFLVEPVEREELIATVESLLRAASAQRTAVRLSHRLLRLNEATLALNDATDVHALIGAIAQQASLLFDSTAAVAIAADGMPLLSVSAPGSPVHVAPISAAALTALLQAARTSPEMHGSDASAACPGLPPGSTYVLSALTGETGVVIVSVPHTTVISKEDVAVLSAFSRSAAAALRNMRSYDIERSIALKLQQNLLPDAVPSLAGLEIVTRYAAGAAHVEVGGDFYEIFSLDENRVAIAIGDVVGHSLEAAMIMAQLRTAIRCFALEGHTPDMVLERLNSVLRRFHPEMSATVCFGVYDALIGSFEYANAGHVPPLHGSSAGWSFLPLGGVLLGVEAPPPPVQRLTVSPGDTLLLYTDGLVERRGESIDDGLERLACEASGDASLAALCDSLLNDRSNSDDAVIVAIRRE